MRGTVTIGITTMNRQDFCAKLLRQLGTADQLDDVLDEVVVMDAGRIVDRGSHEELMQGCSFYREIAEHGLADSVFLQRDLEEREEVARL